MKIIVSRKNAKFEVAYAMLLMLTPLICGTLLGLAGTAVLVRLLHRAVVSGLGDAGVGLSGCILIPACVVSCYALFLKILARRPMLAHAVAVLTYVSSAAFLIWSLWPYWSLWP